MSDSGMRAALAGVSEATRRWWRRDRVRGLVLAIIVEALIVLLLLTLGARELGAPRQQRDLSTFDVALPPAPKAEAPRATVKPRQVARAAAKPPPPATVPPPPTPPVTRPEIALPPNFIRLDSNSFARADIGKITPANPGKADGDASAGDSVAAYGPGQGPNGEPLYNAEWVREPTRAELASYIPPNFREGVAMIACKTAPDNRVENCQSLGEDPPGSGLARGMRQAAWQFRVLPPRKGGKKLIGAWVRIRFDFTRKAEER